jgi:cytochrome b6-f complex iron-sulfur subunit
MDHDSQTRRQFCARTCSAAAVAALGGVMAAALESCGGGSGGPTSPGGVGSFSQLPFVSGTASNGTIVVTVDAASPLAGTGTNALVRSSIGDVLVAHTGTDTFVALSATCTHQNCEITGHSGTTFVCPCHGSTFDSSGRATGGPARGSLQQYKTQFANGVLTIG